MLSDHGSVQGLGPPGTRSLGVLIDLEEDRAARAVVFGLLAEMEQKWRPPQSDSAVDP